MTTSRVYRFDRIRSLMIQAEKDGVITMQEFFEYMDEVRDTLSKEYHKEIKERREK